MEARDWGNRRGVGVGGHLRGGEIQKVVNLDFDSGKEGNREGKSPT